MRYDVFYMLSGVRHAVSYGCNVPCLFSSCVVATVKVRLVDSCRVVKAVCGNGFTLALCQGDPPEDGITPVPTAAYIRNQAAARETGQIRDALGIQQSKGIMSYHYVRLSSCYHVISC